MTHDHRPHVLAIALAVAAALGAAVVAHTLRVPVGLPCLACFALGAFAGYHGRTLKAILWDRKK